MPKTDGEWIIDRVDLYLNQENWSDHEKLQALLTLVASVKYDYGMELRGVVA
jgi:hypothetical protein